MGLTSFNRIRREQEAKKKLAEKAKEAPQKPAVTNEEAQQMVDSGEAEIPAEAVVEEIADEVTEELMAEEADEPEEAPQKPAKSKPAKNRRNQ